MKDCILEKLRFIESDAVPKDGAEIKPSGTSVRITHKCGCAIMQHLFCDRVIQSADESLENYERRQAERAYFVEMCPEHLAEYNKQLKQAEFVELRCECFRILRNLVDKMENRDDFKPTFLELTIKVCGLPQTEAVKNTYKGIIGYYIWLGDNGRLPGNFLESALHDLAECAKNYAENWYSPRTEEYARFYKPGKTT